MNRSLRVAFAGTPEFSVPTLQSLHQFCEQHNHRLVGVLTQPDRPAGRGRKLRQSPVKSWALAHGLAVDQPLTLRSPEGRRVLAGWRPDLLVVVAYGLILPAEVLNLPSLGCVNVHASVLPRWRGAAPIQRAILAGDTSTGVSIMSMDEGLDTGPVWSITKVAITAEDTGASLHDKLAAVGATALVETLPSIIAGSAQAVAQNAQDATYAAKLTKQEARIDWQQSARDIALQIRAYHPWPVAHTLLDERLIKIFQAEVVPDTGAGNAAPGTVLETGKGLYVAAGDGVLDIQILQAAGGRRMQSRDFLHANEILGRRLS